MPPFLFTRVVMNSKITTEDKAVYLSPTPMQVAMRSCCPRCGEGKLYQSVLKPANQCMNCDLDFRFIDSGDGPAVFVILIIGFVVTALAMSVQTAFSPPIWVHMLLWIPLITILSVWGLQFTKSIMIALQYKTRAEQGELDRSGEENA